MVAKADGSVWRGSVRVERVSEREIRKGKVPLVYTIDKYIAAQDSVVGGSLAGETNCELRLASQLDLRH